MGRYNKTDHPIAFHKGDLFAGVKKKIDVGPVPDNEDVFEVRLCCDSVSYYLIFRFV